MAPNDQNMENLGKQIEGAGQAPTDQNKENLGKQIEGVRQKMEEFNLKLKNMDLNKNGSKFQSKFRAPSAEYMEKLRASRYKLEMDARGNNGKVKRLRILDRQKNLEYIRNVLKEENILKEDAEENFVESSKLQE